MKDKVTVGAFGMGVVAGSGVATNDLYIDIGGILLALILYDLSLAFEYGVMLQKGFDDIL